MRKSILAVFALTACGTTTRFTPTNPSPRPLVARPATAVEVFATGLPNRPFVEVGLLQARQSSALSFDEMPEIIAEMRAEAGQRGCEGLVINGTRDASSSTVAISSDTTYASSHTLEGFWGACIVFVAEARAVAASPVDVVHAAAPQVDATSGSAP